MVGQPPTYPVLRPIKQTMYSRVTARMGTTRLIGFQYAMGMLDEMGVPTTASDTNMYQAGQLGTPLEYDVAKVGIHPFGAGREYKEKWDRFLTYNPEFAWVFGGQTRWLTYAVCMMPMEFPFMTASEAMAAQGRDHEFPLALRRVAEEIPLPRLVDLTTPERRMRRISSTESFRFEINFANNAWREPYDFPFYGAMHGVLYTML